MTTASRAKPGNPPITIALIEDNRLVRETLASLIDQQPGLDATARR